MSPFARRVDAVLAALTPGEVVSYGEVAAAAGAPGAARAVGRVLRDLDGRAWWRVVRADGRLAAPDVADQARRLAAEGVTVRAGRVVAPRVAHAGCTQPGHFPPERGCVVGDLEPAAHEAVLLGHTCDAAQINSQRQKAAPAPHPSASLANTAVPVPATTGLKG